MDVIGHPLTYRTTCFINGRCGDAVYAHTNGNGDFVLFNSLGWPWPVHQCFLDRFCASNGERASTPTSDVYTDQELLLELARQNSEYKEAVRQASEDRRKIPQRNIQRVAPETCQSKALSVVGFVQSIVEGHAERFIQGARGMGEQVIIRTLGNRLSQITIVDSDFCSYTAFVDLRNVVLSKGATVKAMFCRTWVLGLNDVFVCDVLDILPIRPR